MVLCSPAPSPALTPMPRMQGVPMSLSRYFDRIAIALSAICIVHCLAIPLLVALVPIAAIGFGGAHFHALMLWLVVPVSVVGFALGIRVHRRFDIVAIGVAALFALTLAGTYGHDHWPAAETFVSIAASLVLAAAHWINFREVRRLHRHGD